MEKSRARRSSREGCGHVQKQRSYPKPGSDSRSHGSDTVDADQFYNYPDHKSSHCTPGTPIKKLLAEEMSKESGSRRRSPGLIARLMGLDGLPPAQPYQKHQNRFSEGHLPATASAETSHRSCTTSGSRSSRKSSKEEQEFKDVFEVLDMSRLEGRNHTSPGSGTLELTRTEMDFIQRKFVNAKRLSADSNLHNSEEFNEVIEDLDCNKDLLLKFLDQRDTLFSKHLRDLQDDRLQSHCSHLQHGTSRPCSRSARGMANRSQRKTVDGPSDLKCPKHAAESQHYPTKVQPEKDESTALSTRIVVLKPNLGRLQNAHRNESSPRSSYDFLSDCEKLIGLPSIMKEPEPIATRRSPERLSRYKSTESRDIARQISTQMRSGLPGGSMKFSASKSRGYAGDESSSNWSDSESACESEMRTLTSKNLMEWSNRYRSSSSRLMASSVNKEARKRLSERWKMNHKSIDMGVVSRGNTLGEMLAVPDRGVRRGDSDAFSSVKGCNQTRSGINSLASGVEPLGISSRDGWKDESSRSLARSRSLPSSSAAISSPRRGVHYETLSHERFLIPKEALQQERGNIVKENFNPKHGERSNLTKENFHQKHGSSSRISRPHSRKPHVPLASTNELGGTSQVRFSLSPLLMDITEKNSAKRYLVAPDTPPNIRLEPSLAPEVVAGSIKTPATSPEMDVSTSRSADAESFLNGLVASGFQERKDSQPVEGSIILQQPAAESESTGSLKEADQPSPVSVLEPSFPDDVSSSSECFGSLSADLQGLRMQLQLLKLESEEYQEGHMLVSSDEDTDTNDASVRVSDESGITVESWQSSYLRDLLVRSGIDDTDPDTYVATCHSMECPVISDLFEEVEKKYDGHASWLRSDRKLLFDRINLALRTIYQKFADPHPWSTPASKVCLRWMKNGLADSVHRLLLGQDEFSALDMAFSTEPGWLDLGDDIDVVGREIERLLTEELVAELVVPV